MSPFFDLPFWFSYCIVVLFCFRILSGYLIRLLLPLVPIALSSITLIRSSLFSRILRYSSQSILVSSCIFISPILSLNLFTLWIVIGLVYHVFCISKCFVPIAESPFHIHLVTLVSFLFLIYTLIYLLFFLHSPSAALYNI